MPSPTPKVARLMAAVAHGWHKPGGGGPSVAVAKEFNKADKGTAMLSKGMKLHPASYAAGGPVLGRTREFLKESVDFRSPEEGNQKEADNDNLYAKSGIGSGTGVVPIPPNTKKKIK